MRYERADKSVIADRRHRSNAKRALPVDANGERTTRDRGRGLGERASS